MNRKATFAKRQRESDLKDHARAKEARKAARQGSARTGKGPEIAWDEAVYATTATDEEKEAADAGLPTPTPPASEDSAADSPASLVPTDDSP